MLPVSAVRFAPFGRARALFSPGSYGSNWTRQQIAHPHEVVRCRREGEHPAHFLDAAMAHLTDQRDRFQPAEAFFDPLPVPLADPVAVVACGALIDGAATVALLVLGHVRRDIQMPALGDEIFRVVSFIGSDRDAIRSSITKAASHSAVPLAWNDSVLTISPLRFSVSRLPL